MKKYTVVLDFLRFSIPNKIAFGRTVLSKMVQTSLFAEPDLYATLSEIVNKLEGFYVSSRGGNHEQIALMHQTEEEFDDAFRKLANNVERMADGDEAIILSTGFHLSKQPVPADIPEFSVEAGNTPGTILLKRKAVVGAMSYVWQHYIGSQSPVEESWLFGGSSTKASYEMKDFTSATKGWFRVAAVTKAGMQPFTDAIMKVVP